MAGSIYQLFGFRLLQADPRKDQSPAIEQSSITSAKVGLGGGGGGGGETGPIQNLHSSVSAKVGGAGETGPINPGIEAIHGQ